MAVGLPALEGLRFRPDKPHTACRICGAVYQSDADRELPSYLPADDAGMAAYEVWAAESQRRRWSDNHAKTHTTTQHRQLALSGRFCTVEAAGKLASYGIISLSDAIFDPDYAEALLEISPIPDLDSEG